MPLRAIGFSFLFLYCAIGALYNPIYGILGYMAQYIIGFERQWWHASLRPLGIHYSLTFAVLTATGIFLNQKKLRFKKLLVRQEILALLLLVLICLLFWGGADIVNRYAINDYPPIKISKLMIFCLMMTHVITSPRDLDKVMWLLVVGSLILGMQAYEMPRSAFTGGRLDGVVGGTDFLNSNALASFMVASTIITGTVFMRTSWYGKLLCVVAGALSLNTIVLCRSRGALLALLGAGIAIIFIAPRHVRRKLIVGMFVVVLGMVYVSDAQFLNRMTGISKQTGAVIEGEKVSDRSSEMRIDAWRGGIQMFCDHPFGVGPGNFNQYIGRYAPSVEGMSPHSTYIQALAELGFLGLILVLALLGNGLLMVRNVIRISDCLPESERLIIQWSSCGLGAVIVGYASSGLTGHLVYFEGFWWFLLLPVCLQRATENALEALPATTPDTPVVETVDYPDE